MQIKVVWIAMAAVLAVIGGACSAGTVEEADQSTTVGNTATTQASTTTSQATATSVGPEKTIPPALAPLEAKYPVVMTSGLSGDDTQEITVWAPDADGSWPVVYALHGHGFIHDWAEMATILAGQGVVVFAADHRWELMQTAQWRSVYEDAECGYRYARNVAAEYGGDLNQPVTVIGHSLGATLGLHMTVNDTVFGPDSDGSFTKCPQETPRPDVIVGISGCHYQFEDQTFRFDPSELGWGHQDADVVLVVGNDDEVCEAWQSEDATDELRSDGYDVNLVTIDSADHLSVIFHAFTDDEFLTLPDDPGGLQATQAILDAISAAAS